MKIRIDRTLYNRARACADDVGTSLWDWSERALRQYQIGKLGVAVCDQAHPATRGSVVASLPCGSGQEDEMRCALSAAIVYCEARRPPAFKTPLVVGKDYYVETEE